jgi:hypothetical protein
MAACGTDKIGLYKVGLPDSRSSNAALGLSGQLRCRNRESPQGHVVAGSGDECERTLHSGVVLRCGRRSRFRDVSSGEIPRQGSLVRSRPPLSVV